MNITGTGVEKPVVVLTVPKGITIKYYPKEDDQTLRPDVYKRQGLTPHSKRQKQGDKCRESQRRKGEGRDGGQYTWTCLLYTSRCV